MIWETTDADTIISQERKLKARLVLKCVQEHTAKLEPELGARMQVSAPAQGFCHKGCLINISIYAPDHNPDEMQSLWNEEN